MFIYSFNHVFISALTQGYLFYSFGYNSILCLLILMLKQKQLWPMGALLGWLLCPFDMLPFFFIFKFLSTSLFGATRCFRFISYFLCSTSEISHFSGEIDPLNEEWCLGNKIWMMGVLIAAEVSLHLDPLVDSARNHFMYIKTHSHIYISVSIYLLVC